MTFYRVFMVLLLLFFSTFANAQAVETDLKEISAASVVQEKESSSIKMLFSIAELQKRLNSRISEKRERFEKSSSEAEKETLKSELTRLDKQLNAAIGDFEQIATGIDTGLFAEKDREEFDWQDEILSLVKPGIKEIKRLTLKARQKTKLKEEISRYETILPVAHNAIENIRLLVSKTSEKKLQRKLKGLLPEWKGVAGQIENNYKIAAMQLAKMEQGEKPFVETFQDSIKNFFRTRGLFLSIAVFACLCVGFFFRLFYRLLVKFIPGYTSKYRSFYIRAFDLGFKLIALICTLSVTVLVFYLAEDWVLLSLTIIFIIGIVWAIKHTLPKLWHQSRLMLNIGAVREGERILYHGLPWRVKEINFFCKLANPSLGISLRLPIEELLGKISRPVNRDEPWFPCKRNDWVILEDGIRGKVTNLSHEMVELVQRGGAQKIYQTQDFLAQSPLNLSTGFRLKVLFGINYDHQQESTGSILKILHAYIQEQIIQEGYSDDLLNLRVEFNSADDSSLGLVVIVDFTGKMAPLYQRLKRAIQRWCVDACTENEWNIPFPHLTIHS
ncbi:MAG: hypothetical protein U9N77_11485 [Thermodesulfobacteriota bacterium]|nr:hypothetical protein [Thermodesulfobacteriota bacterium]